MQRQKREYNTILITKEFQAGIYSWTIPALNYEGKPTRQPFLEGCKYLKEQGRTGFAELKWYDINNVYSLRAKISVAAELTVAESKAGGKPAFIKRNDWWDK